MLTKKWLLTIGLIAGLSGSMLGLFVAQHLHRTPKFDPSRFHGTLLTTPRTLQSFNLMGTDNRPFTNASLQGHWTLFFFGFTHCGSMCPTTMAELGKTYRILESKSVKSLPQVMMISLDPERDTLEHLGQYARAFDPHFVGARGDTQTIKQLTHELGVAYAKIKKQDDQNYDIEHTGAIMLINPQGQLTAFFTTPHQAQLIAEDYMLLNVGSPD